MNRSAIQFDGSQEPAPPSGGQGLRVFFLGLGVTGIIGAGIIGWEVYGAEARTKLEETVESVKELAGGVAEKMNPEWLDGNTVFYTVDQDTGGLRLATREEIEEHKEYQEALAESMEWDDPYGGS